MPDCRISLFLETGRHRQGIDRKSSRRTSLKVALSVVALFRMTSGIHYAKAVAKGGRMLGAAARMPAGLQEYCQA